LGTGLVAAVGRFAHSRLRRVTQLKEIKIMGTSSSSHRRTRPFAIPAALAVVAVVVVGCSQQPAGPTGAAGPVTTQDQPTSASSAPSVEASVGGTQGDGAITEPPLEFTACIPKNRYYRTGTDEQITLPSPDGDVTVDVSRGFTWRGTITATDDRLSGTHYNSFNSDTYTLPGGGTQMAWAEAHQIENDEGTWQGSSVGFSDTGDDSETGPTVLIGEGAYEGLTAIIVTSIEGDCFLNVRGFVTSVPATPAPVTEE
jgi:hypothetical protein